MAYSFRNPSDGIIKHYLETSKIIAVVGLSDREDTTSHRVQGDARAGLSDYSCQPPSRSWWPDPGETVYASLQEIPFPVDIVDVYRRSEFYQMWHVILLRRMRKFSGHNWSWKIKKQKKSFVELDGKISS